MKRSWDDLIRRHAPDAHDRPADPFEPPVPEHHRALRAVARLHRDGAAPRAALDGGVGPDRRRHPADAQRARLPRRAGAHGGVLLLAAAPLADRAGARGAARPRGEALHPGRRPDPRHAVPGGHHRVLPLAPVDVRGVRRARPRGLAAPLRRAHVLRRRRHPRADAAARGRLLPRASSRRAATRWARSSSTARSPRRSRAPSTEAAAEALAADADGIAKVAARELDLDEEVVRQGAARRGDARRGSGPSSRAARRRRASGWPRPPRSSSPCRASTARSATSRASSRSRACSAAAA